MILNKNVKVDNETWRELAKKKIDLNLNKIADVIKNSMFLIHKFTDEKRFREWFKDNYSTLGFTHIIEENINISPDFIMGVDKEEVRVELETLSSHFILHKHNKNDVDLVLCLLIDKDIGVKTIQIPNLIYDTIDKTYIQISKEVANNLNELKLVPRESYEDVLRRLLNMTKRIMVQK